MNKFFLMLYLSVLSLGIARAAPYHLDAPIESYTWGESMKTVMESDKQADWNRVSDDTIMLLDEKATSAIFFRFWHGKLAEISKSYSLKNLTPEKKEAIYQRLLVDFTAKWGTPRPEAPCVGNPFICSEVIWQASDVTQVSLHKSTEKAANPFVGYDYSSRDLLHGYQQEIREYGVRHPIEYLLRSFKNESDVAQTTLKGKRVRLEGVVVKDKPLVLEYGGYEITPILRDVSDANVLKPGQFIEVSGIIEGATGRAVKLTDTILVPLPVEQDIVIDRHGKKPKGFFPAETFYASLNRAAGMTLSDFSIYGYSSRPRMEGRRVVVDYLPNQLPEAISFSLESLYPDKSSDTVAFNLSMKDEDRETVPYMIEIGMGIILNATQPDQPMKEIYAQIEDILKKGGKKVINGWTYQCKKQNDKNFTFSATAPKH